MMFWFLLSFSVSDPEFCKSQGTEEEEKEGEVFALDEGTILMLFTNKCLFSSIKHKMRSSIERNKKKNVLSYYKVVDLNFCTDDLHPCKKLGSTENFSNFLVCFPHHYYMVSDNVIWHTGSMD